MTAYATAVSEASRDDLITELFRHKDAKDAAREEGRRQGLIEAAEIARCLPMMAASKRDLSMKCEGALEVAAAIEAKGGEPMAGASR